MSEESKISPQFQQRLEDLKPGQMITAIVVTKGPAFEDTGERPTRGQRRARISERRETTQRMQSVIASLLAEESQGKVLEQDLGTLGSIVVYATAEGLRRLAAEPNVEAILEDQKLHLLYDPPNVKGELQAAW
jgi:hypothetical protein